MKSLFLSRLLHRAPGPRRSRRFTVRTGLALPFFRVPSVRSLPRPPFRAFTLIELLIVLAIIGLLSALALPHLKGLTRSNIMTAANQQLLDDIALARQRAINNRSPVYMVFVPPLDNSFDFIRATNRTLYNQLVAGQYTSYTTFADRTVGDQPGRPFRRYLSGWKNLPDGVFFATNKFFAPYPISANGINKQVLPFEYGVFPFPSSDTPTNPPLLFPFIKFNEQGRLVSASAAGTCIIPLARGSILLHPSANDPLQLEAEAPVERPPMNSIDTNSFNHIEIEALTGRARLDRRTL